MFAINRRISIVLFFIWLSPANAEPIGFKDWERLLNFITDVKRGAVAQAVADDDDATPKIEVKGSHAGAGLFGRADTDLQSATRDNSHAEARARNTFFGRHIVYTGNDKNLAGDNGAFSSYAAITWKGKIVKGVINALFDPTKLNEIHQIVGDRLQLKAESEASFRLSLAYKIVSSNDTNDGWWDEALFSDDLVKSHGFSSLFKGEITLGDSTKDIFSGDFLGLEDLFEVSVDQLTHLGSVSYLLAGSSAVDFIVPMPPFTADQMLLIAADQQASVSAKHGGHAIVTTIPEPTALVLLSAGIIGMAMSKLSYRNISLPTMN